MPFLKNDGGALINVGSALSDRAIPLQGNYSAAKHAIKGFTDALRMELEEEGAAVSVTLIKPSSIDTPFFDKARSHMGVEPQPVPPVYAPELVADAILAAAERPVRDLIVGGSGRMLSMSSLAPRAADAYMERTLFDSQKTDKPVFGRADNLFGPVAHDGGERGHNWQGRTIRRSASRGRRAAGVAARRSLRRSRGRRRAAGVAGGPEALRHTSRTPAPDDAGIQRCCGITA